MRSQLLGKVIAMTIVIEYYIPEKFRRPSGKSIPPSSAGRSFCLLHRKKSRHETKKPRSVHASDQNPLLRKPAREWQGTEEFEGKPAMSCRIDRLVNGEDLVILRISGRISGLDVDVVRTSLEQDGSVVAIDLKEVLLVDREAVKLLALCESNGAELRNCPAYIREWITRERADTNGSEQE